MPHHTHARHPATLLPPAPTALQLLEDEFRMGLHALSLSTKTPAEAEGK